MKKNILSIISLLALALSFTSCSKKEETGTGYIQFTNASELSSPLDFYVSDSKKNNSALTYNQSTAYFPVSSKQQPAAIKVALTGATDFAFQVTPMAGTYYSIFYFSKGATIAYQDDLTMPATGKARVRFVNLNVKSIAFNDFSISGGAKIISNLESKLVSNYVDVEPGADFIAYVAGSTTVVSNIPTDVEAGHIYTVYLSGEDVGSMKGNVLLQK
jgi:hypothetical protein